METNEPLELNQVELEVIEEYLLENIGGANVIPDSCWRRCSRGCGYVNYCGA